MRKMCVTALLGLAFMAAPSFATQSDQPTTVIASYYKHGTKTASGEHFRPEGLTAAHRTLPFGTRVRVTNRANLKSAIVKINDRGPFVRSRGIDLSLGAARQIGMLNAGVAKVTLEII